MLEEGFQQSQADTIFTDNRGSSKLINGGCSHWHSDIFRIAFSSDMYDGMFFVCMREQMCMSVRVGGWVCVHARVRVRERVHERVYVCVSV